jgi:hypothetical protein
LKVIGGSVEGRIIFHPIFCKGLHFCNSLLEGIYSKYLWMVKYITLNNTN